MRIQRRVGRQRQSENKLDRTIAFDPVIPFPLISPANALSIRRKTSGPNRPSLSAERQRLSIGAKAALSSLQIPAMDFMIVAARGCRPAAIRTNGGREHDVVMAGIADDLSPTGNIVDMAVVLCALKSNSRQQSFAVRAEAEIAYRSVLAHQHSAKGARLAVPQPDLAIIIARGDCPIRGDIKNSRLYCYGRSCERSARRSRHATVLNRGRPNSSPHACHRA